MDIKWTPIQGKMIAMLSDGRRHTREELHTCCGPSSVSTVRYHLSEIRKKLPDGEDIVVVFERRRLWYQHVRLLSSAYE